MPNLNRVLFGLGAVFGIAALCGALIFFHTRAVSKYGNERAATATAAAYASVEHKAHELELKANALAAQLRERNDAETRTIERDASAMRLRGPGNALCTRIGPTDTLAGGHDAPGGQADASVDTGVHERSEFIALPFTETLNQAAQCDANRAEVISWRAQREGTK